MKKKKRRSKKQHKRRDKPRGRAGRLDNKDLGARASALDEHLHRSSGSQSARSKARWRPRDARKLMRHVTYHGHKLPRTWREDFPRVLRALPSKHAISSFEMMLRRSDDDDARGAITQIRSKQARHLVLPIAEIHASLSLRKRAYLIDVFAEHNVRSSEPIILANLSSGDERLQISCLRALGALGGPRAYGALEEYTTHKTPSIARAAKKAQRALEARYPRGLFQEAPGALSVADGSTIGALTSVDAPTGVLSLYERCDEIVRAQPPVTPPRDMDRRVQHLDRLITWSTRAVVAALCALVIAVTIQSIHLLVISVAALIMSVLVDTISSYKLARDH